jgi:hypothetical protein
MGIGAQSSGTLGKCPLGIGRAVKGDQQAAEHAAASWVSAAG